MDRPVRLALCASLVSAAALAACALAALRWAPAHAVDSSALTGFVSLGSARVRQLSNTVAHLGDPAPYGLAGLLLAGLALKRRRRRSALAIVGLLLAGPFTTEVLLKPLLAVPRVDPGLSTAGQIANGSFPSGHATASMILALCLILAVPPRVRPLAAVVAAAIPLAVSYALLTLGWHYPSDVFGGYLVAMMWASLAVAWLLAGPGRIRRPVRHRVRLSAVLGPPVLAALAAGGLAVVALLARPAAASFAQQHTAAIAAAGGMAVLALGLATGLAVELRR